MANSSNAIVTLGIPILVVAALVALEKSGAVKGKVDQPFKPVPDENLLVPTYFTLGR